MKKILSFITSALLMVSAICPVTASAEEEKINIMPLGDSITDGFWLTGGYRTTFYNNLKENGYADGIDLVGPNWGGDGDPNHAGYSGYSIDNIEQADSISGARTGISSFADWLMESYPADVIMLQIGTNDILSYYDLDNITVRLENLVRQLLTYVDDDGMIFVATIPCMDASNTLYISEYHFTVESMDAIVDKYNTEIKQMVADLQAEGENVALADINSAVEKSDLYDGVHPNETGYKKMGDYWYGIISNYLDGNSIPEVTEPVVTTTEIIETTITEPIETTTETTVTEITSETTVTETTWETMAPTTEPDIFDGIRGDINNNEKIDCLDMVMMKNIMLNIQTMPYIDSADMNNDGVLNISDLTLLSQKLLATE